MSGSSISSYTSAGSPIAGKKKKIIFQNLKFKVIYFILFSDSIQSTRDLKMKQKTRDIGLTFQYCFLWDLFEFYSKQFLKEIRHEVEKLQNEDDYM